MTLLPDWAPNLHPLFVHFPIALLIAAVVVDVCALVLPRAVVWPAAASGLYLGGALSALATYLTGRQAAAAVLMPGMVHTIVLDHWNWALATTIFYSSIATVRVGLALRRRQPSHWARAALTLAAVLGMVLLFHTAEQGARLVYEHGVGVQVPVAGR